MQKKPYTMQRRRTAQERERGSGICPSCVTALSISVLSLPAHARHKGPE